MSFWLRYCPPPAMTRPKSLLSTTYITHMGHLPLRRTNQSLTPLTSTRLTSIQCCTSYTNSPSNMVSVHGSWELTLSAKNFPGMDYKHWHVTMDDEGATYSNKEDNIKCIIKTLAQALPSHSEEEAMKKIYKVRCISEGRQSEFGCEVDWVIAMNLLALDNVRNVVADYYADYRNQDYTGKPFEKLQDCFKPSRMSSEMDMRGDIEGLHGLGCQNEVDMRGDIEGLHGLGCQNEVFF